MIVFFLFAGLLIWLSFRSFLGGIAYFRFFRDELTRPPSVPISPVTVIAPFRGKEQYISENLSSLKGQDHPDFEVIFVVDDISDPAIPFIQKFLSGRSKSIVAPKATDSSQKVENLIAGVAAADDRSEIFVFVDSDTRLNRSWLRELVGPLADPAVGASTGYRWFISRDWTFASELRSAWNASIATALGPGRETNFCWGGSMAIRRDVFERLKIADRWRGTLSDDFTVTRVMKEAGMPIVFVPGALTASIGKCGFAEMLEFTTRQMKITRVYAPPLWLMSLIGSGIFISVMLSAVLLLVFSVDTVERAAAAATLLLVGIFSTGKAWLRLKAVRLALPGFAAELKRQQWTQLSFWLLTPFVFLYNCVSAMFSRRIDWRGTVYELKSPDETVIISD